jgi:hypothetical protein
VFLDLRIVKELRVHFVQVRIVKALADYEVVSSWLLLADRCVGGNCGCGWPGVGETNAVVDEVYPGFVGVDEFGFILGHGQGEEHYLAQIGERGGGTLGDAVLGQGGEDFAHHVVDVGGGQEIAGEGGGHFRAQAVGFEELVLGVGVEEAESGAIFMAKHAASAAVGEGELTEVGMGVASCGHGGHL